MCVTSLQAKFQYACEFLSEPQAVEILNLKPTPLTYVDPTLDHGRAVLSCVVHDKRALLEELCNWDGTMGEYVNLAGIQEALVQTLVTCTARGQDRSQILAQLLKWRGRRLEWFDPTCSDNALLKAACRHTDLNVLEALLDWTGDDGTEVGISSLIAEMCTYAMEHTHVHVQQSLNNALAWRNGDKL